MGRVVDVKLATKSRFLLQLLFVSRRGCSYHAVPYYAILYCRLYCIILYYRSRQPLLYFGLSSFVGACGDHRFVQEC